MYMRKCHRMGPRAIRIDFTHIFVFAMRAICKTLKSVIARGHIAITCLSHKGETINKGN